MYEESHITTGEFSRWLRDDREWKAQMLTDVRGLRQEAQDQGERLTALETLSARADSAEGSAKVSKRWAIVAACVAAIMQGIHAALK